jgi:glycosyltransferase involved in cell wall biosynthesis
MPSYFNYADVMLVTLKKDPIFAMTIPAKLQSYLACAKPVIAALDGEGGRVIKESGAGVAVPAQDADALAETVLSIYNIDGHQRQEMGRRGRAYFDDHFSRSLLLSRLDEWLKHLKPV